MEEEATIAGTQRKTLNGKRVALATPLALLNGVPSPQPRLVTLLPPSWRLWNQPSSLLPRADEEATELANDDNGHASSLGDDDAIEEAPGDAAGDDVQAAFHSPAATVHQPSESWSRSGR